MTGTLKVGLVSVLLALGITTPGLAQSNLVQTLNFSLTALNQASSSAVKPVRITTKDVIRLFSGKNLANGRLQLVTPVGNPPGTIGNLKAFLRVTSGNTVITVVPSPSSFNLFQDFATVDTGGKKIVTSAVNRFSIDFGAFHAELQGFSTWNSAPGSGSGAFTSKVNGRGTVDGVTQVNVPIQGTITASTPKLGS